MNIPNTIEFFSSREGKYLIYFIETITDKEKAYKDISTRDFKLSLLLDDKEHELARVLSNTIESDISFIKGEIVKILELYDGQKETLDDMVRRAEGLIDDMNSLSKLISDFEKIIKIDHASPENYFRKSSII